MTDIGSTVSALKPFETLATNVVAVDFAHNSPGAECVKYSQEAEDRVMAALPKALADWLRYDAPGDTCPVEIFREWRRGAAVDHLLRSLAAVRREDTRRDYGWNHPQAFAA